MQIAITGHRELPEPTVNLVSAAIRRWLAENADTALTGLTCLADGADRIFAHAVLDAGGSLVVVVPAAEYRDGMPAEHHRVYDALISRPQRWSASTACLPGRRGPAAVGRWGHAPAGRAESALVQVHQAAHHLLVPLRRLRHEVQRHHPVPVDEPG
jgi:hypothetical protein